MTHPALVLQDRLNELAEELKRPLGKGARHAFERHLQSLQSAVGAYTRQEKTAADWFAEQEAALEELRLRLRAARK